MRYESGAEQLTLWPEVSPASHTALLGAARGERTSVTCGPSSHEWCERSDPDGCSLRTSLASALQQRTRCSLIWKKRATPLGRSWWVLTTLERPTVARGCGLSPGSDWPTVTANESETRTNRGGSNGRVGPERPMLAGAVKLWPTWHTPQAQDCEQAGSANRPALTHQTRLSCEAGPPDPESRSGSGKRRDWPTAQAHDAAGPPGSGTQGRGGRSADLTRAVDPTVTTRGALNPEWVCQLMGVPDGWLDSDPSPDVLGLRRSATASSRRSSRKSAAPSSRRR